MKSITLIGRSLTLVMMTWCAIDADSPANVSKPTSFIDRRDNVETSLRIMSWNVYRGSIFPPNGKREESFKRIVAAVKPDVLCLQEVGGPRVETELPGLMDSLLPLEAGQWRIHYAPNSDNVVISRYPLMHCSHEDVKHLPTIAPKFHLGYVACKVDLPESPDDIYLVAAHFLSAGNGGISDRQRHADAIVRHLRQLRSDGEGAILPQATPIVILGDFNVYAQEPNDAAHHLTTLLTGNIVNEIDFGPDIDLDWDGSFLVEVKPRHNGDAKEWYTWRSDEAPYPPGALDRIIFTDSVMKADHGFVLNTTIMSAEALSRHGLEETDVLRDSKPGDFDHLPLVVDFSLRSEEIAKLRSSQQSQ